MDIPIITCPYCGKKTHIRFKEFTLTYCEECGVTYGCEYDRHKNNLIIYTVEEHHREEIA